MRNGSVFCSLMAVLLLVAPASQANESSYESPLLRLAEVLGSIHYLRNLCGEETEAWRGKMEELLETEAPSPARREKLIASFNRGYRSFAGTYEKCTDQALSAIDHYMNEGARISTEIVQRYGN
ncbi:TIGR02301 family protein [Nitratireductor kimnyeongensis]|uniref:TIGR02301 family protein n=1 Tax=Nitratireductor kimnyeongensis TaxID=430679 RepID=A0ABW0T414_9HYPH|nr:TIGR02301 family protein [Nitratireductor kimnyeongensis]QZZ35083.1 TIGR02301 family protein [Nitratireductor kimnyeongensis]